MTKISETSNYCLEHSQNHLPTALLWTQPLPLLHLKCLLLHFGASARQEHWIHQNSSAYHIYPLCSAISDRIPSISLILLLFLPSALPFIKITYLLTFPKEVCSLLCLSVASSKNSKTAGSKSRAVVLLCGGLEFFLFFWTLSTVRFMYKSQIYLWNKS